MLRVAQIIFFATVLVLIASLQTVNAKTIDIPIEEDTYVEEKFPTVSPWNNRNLYVGTEGWYGKGKTRILVLPDFSVLVAARIAIGDIEKAELLLTSYSYEGTDDTATIDTYTTTSPWSMESVTWNTQPTLSTKKDTTLISTTAGKKTITVTQGLIYAYGTYPTARRGLLLKINAETEKALIFWAHGCDIAPSPPICESSADRPLLRVTYRDNLPPPLCTLKSPAQTTLGSSTVAISHNAVIDPEGDELRYIGRVCADLLCETVIWQSEFESSPSLQVDLDDGQYFAACSATDGLHDEEWGSIVAFNTDTTPPPSPVLLEEPPFTGTKTNTVTWLPIQEDAVQYQVLSSERSDFRSYNTYSPWTSENRLTLQHTKEDTFYYKVRSKDAVGNISGWSNSTSTIIDGSIPVIRYFKTNTTLISPKISKSGDVSENAYIQGGIDEENIQEITVNILGSTGKQVFTQSVTQKSYLWLHWPEKAGYPDGTYVAQLIAEDAVGNQIVSDHLVLTIDTSPPSKPIFIGITDKQAFTKQSITVGAMCKERAQLTVYLSGKIIATGKDRETMQIAKSDGSYTLSASCTDSVGNKSASSLTFLIDTTPPAPPSLTYEHNKATKSVTLSGYCREKGSIRFYKSGVELAAINCDKGKYAKYALPGAIDLPYKATFTVRASDNLGNISSPSEKTVFLAPEENTSRVKTIECSMLYNSSTRETESFGCDTESLQLLSYTKTDSINKNEYLSALAVSSPTHAKISLTVTRCKNKSLWDPRTWYSCVSQIGYEAIVLAKPIPVLSSKSSLTNLSEELVTLQHQKVDSLKVNEQIFIHFTTFFGTELFSYDFFSPKQTRTIIPKYPTSNSLAYFSWIFSGPRNVSQWHGNTAFEKPHGGIDFSVANEQFFAPAKGKVISSGYHQSSKCYGGGNYIGIKHPNGLYTYYFHLASTTFPNGKKITVGTTINSGDKLARTGNSGMYNCEKLAAHLHFEVRTTGEPKSHLNPVPYFAIDWNSVKTSRTDKYPGRLTGDNPHPKF